MYKSNTQLLCTFSKLEAYDSEVSALFEYYVIPDKRVFVLQSTVIPADIFLTYNVEKSVSTFYPRTMSVHRKKEFNIIYSINALNELVRRENNGIASRNFQIDWQQHRNSIITSRDGNVKITPTRLLKVFKI